MLSVIITSFREQSLVTYSEIQIFKHLSIHTMYNKYCTHCSELMIPFRNGRMGTEYRLCLNSEVQDCVSIELHGVTDGNRSMLENDWW